MFNAVKQQTFASETLSIWYYINRALISMSPVSVLRSLYYCFNGKPFTSIPLTTLNNMTNSVLKLLAAV